MSTSVQVTFHGIEPSEYVRKAVQEHVDKIQNHHELSRCRVVIDSPHHHSKHGHLYSVRIDAGVKGADLFVNHDRHDAQAHEDVYVALRDAFAALEHQLERRTDRTARRRVE